MAKKHFIFNVNMIVAGLSGALLASKVGSIFDSLYSQNELTSFVISVFHFIFAFLIFTSLHFFTNLKKYKSYFNKKLWFDFAKIYGTFIPSLIIFYIVFFGVNDVMLHFSFSVLVSSVSAWFTGTLISRIIHTFLADKIGVFKN